MGRNLFDNPLLLVVLVLLIVVVFGAKRLPDAARSLGRSMRIFKSEVKELKADGASSAPAPSSATPSSSATPPVGQPPLEGRVVPHAADAASPRAGEPVDRHAAGEHRSGA